MIKECHSRSPSSSSSSLTSSLSLPLASTSSQVSVPGSGQPTQQQQEEEEQPRKNMMTTTTTTTMIGRRTISSTTTSTVLLVLIVSVLSSLVTIFHSTIPIDHIVSSSSSSIISLSSSPQQQQQQSIIGSSSTTNQQVQQRQDFVRNEFRMDNFVVAGVNLARFGLIAELSNDDDDDNDNDANIDDNDTTQEDNNRHHHHPQASSLPLKLPLPYELFEDFDLSSQLLGNETWLELIGYRRDANYTTLSFYVDKVARKRWLAQQSKSIHNGEGKSGQNDNNDESNRNKNGNALDGLLLEPFVLKYGSELLNVGTTKKQNGDEDKNDEGNVGHRKQSLSSSLLPLPFFSSAQKKEEQQRQALLQLLGPIAKKDYVAKPTHLSCAGGVWLTKVINETIYYVGNGKQPMSPYANFTIDVIATDLAKQLQKVQTSCGRSVKESIALQRVQPGIVIEERFTTSVSSLSSKSTTATNNNDNENGNDIIDRTGGTEFKVFTIWGRMFLGIWRPGMDGAVGLYRRDGTNINWSGRNDPPLPGWISWDKVVSIAERSGANKDMFRTDIFVGVASSFSSSSLITSDTTNNNNNNNIRYVISESEIHPTEIFHYKKMKKILDEGSRLWLAGYINGNYRVVPNSEVPSIFVEQGMLPENFE